MRSWTPLRLFNFDATRRQADSAESNFSYKLVDAPVLHFAYPTRRKWILVNQLKGYDGYAGARATRAWTRSA
jgi:hypothetical protein